MTTVRLGMLTKAIFKVLALTFTLITFFVTNKIYPNSKLMTLIKSTFMKYDQNNSGSDLKGSCRGNVVFDLVFG